MHSAVLPSNDFYQAKSIDVTSTRVTTDHQRIESFNTHFSLLQKIYRKINPTVLLGSFQWSFILYKLPFKDCLFL